MEDAVSLAACVAKAGCKEKIPDATRVHNLLRFERVSCLQAFGVVNQAKMSAKNSASNKTTKGGVHFGRWILTHNPEEYADQLYDEVLSHLKHGTPFQNTNIPPGLMYKPWTIDSLLLASERGEETILDGDWD